LNDLQAYLDAMIAKAKSSKYLSTYNRWDAPQQILQTFITSGYSTIDDLYDQLKDMTTPTDSIKSICEFIPFTLFAHRYYRMPRLVDRRSVIHPLLAALNHPDDEAKYHVIWALGRVGNQCAVKPLIRLATTSDLEGVRHMAILALGGIATELTWDTLLAIIQNDQASEGDRLNAVTAMTSHLATHFWEMSTPRDKTILMALAQNETESITLRAAVIEALAFYEDPQVVNLLIEFLDHPIPTLRFWASYSLCELLGDIDISAALPKLDRIIKDEHQVIPQFWQLSREPLLAFEGIYYEKLAPDVVTDFYPSTFVISPEPEYSDVWAAYQQNTEKLLERKTDLKIDPVWFGQQLTTKWPETKLNVREPKPQSLSLDWLISMKDVPLSGGLHVDGYSVFVTGHDGDVLLFAKWYRSVIDTRYTLRIYPWAADGVIVTPALDKVYQ